MKVKLKEKIGYSLGDVSANLVFQVCVVFQLKFYTDVFGLEGAVAGLVLLVAAFANIIIDPAVGIIADQTHSRWGKYRPWLLWSAIPFALFYVMAFYNPGIEDTALVAVYATVSFILLMCAYSFCNIPYAALGAVMSGEPEQRNSINSIRFIATIIGQLLVQGLTLPLVSKFGAGDTARGWLCTVSLYAVVLVVCLLIAFATTRERIEQPAYQQRDIKKDVRHTMACMPWRIMIVVVLFLFIALASWGSAMSFYFQYNIDQTDLYSFLHDLGLTDSVPLCAFMSFFNLSALSENDAYSVGFSLFNIIGTLVQLISMIALSQFLARRFGKRSVLLVCLSLTAIFTILFYFPNDQDIESLYVLNILKGIAYGPTIPLLWAMMADVADYVEYVSGRRATAFCFSCIIFALQLGVGAGNAFTGVILSAFGYSGGMVEQNDIAIEGIRIASSLAPALLFVICIIALFFYPITKDFNEEMQLDLADRREISSGRL